jgi:predicted TIM-barrel fold metal-dependent hydrolase
MMATGQSTARRSTVEVARHNQSIVDAHHHIWRVGQTPWLNGPPLPRIFGDYAPLRRDYLVDEYMADAIPVGIVKSVYVQVNVAPGKEIEEVAWVQSVADQCRFPHAITAFADLSDPGVGDVLDREMASGNVRAIRQQLHWHKNPRYRFACRPDTMNDAGWRRGLERVAHRGLMFELQVFAGQMRDAVALVRDFPNLTFILMHAGMLEDRSEEGWSFWRTGMRILAECPNVMVKISGLGTFEHECSQTNWRPVIEQTIDLFGPARCLFGSNFPIEKLWTSYAELVGVVRACLSGFADHERRAVLHDTAARLYGL